MKDDVESILVGEARVLLLHLLDHERHVGLFKFVKNGLLALGLRPLMEKNIERGETPSYCIARVVLHGHRRELAVRAENLHDLVDDPAVAGADDVELRRGVRFRRFLRAVLRRFLFPVVIADGALGVRNAVEVWVDELGRDVAEVEDVEEELALGGVDARSASDHLLELGHGLDLLVKHDKAAGLAVHAGFEEFARRDDCRIRLVRVDEVIELLLASRVVGRNAHHVAAVLLAFVGIQLYEEVAHLQRLLLVGAEHDCLSLTSNGVEHLRDPAGDDLPTDVDGELAPHVGAVEEPLVDQVVVEVFLVRLRLPAFEVDVEERLRDAVRREEAVRDALREGIDVERLAVRLLAEVVEIVRSLDGLRRGGHAYLSG